MSKLMNKTEKSIAIFVTILFLFVLIMSVSRVNTETRNIWSSEEIDYYSGTYISSAVDNDGAVHLLYYNYNIYELRYARKVGANWTIETLYNDDDRAEKGRGPSMVLDSKGNPHISYSYWKYPEELRYARWSGTEWVKELVYDATSNNRISLVQTSIALDTDDRPHIAYFHINQENSTLNVTIRLAHWTGTTWHHEVVDFVNHNSNSYVRMDLDTLGNPHIIYSFDNNHGIKYARWSNGSWKSEIIDNRIQLSDIPSIAVDDDNIVHLSYADLSEVWYARCANTSWTFTCVDGDTRIKTSLALDSHNNPYICFANDNELRYAKMRDNQWRVETVLDGLVGAKSLCFDANDNPHIICNYKEDWDYKLRYAKIVAYDSDGDGITDSDDFPPEFNNEIIYLIFGFGSMNVMVILAIVGLSKLGRKQRDGEDTDSTLQNEDKS